MDMRSQHSCNVLQAFGSKGKITQESIGKIAHISYKWRQTWITWTNINSKKQYPEM